MLLVYFHETVFIEKILLNIGANTYSLVSSSKQSTFGHIMCCLHTITWYSRMTDKQYSSEKGKRKI